jgi:outer membrane protein OmpA-like peptidoglycan-associated protein
MRQLGPMMLLAVLALPGAAQAEEPWLLRIEADFVAPLAAPQTELFGPGAAASISVDRALNDWLLLGLRLRAGFLSDGPRPSNTALADPGIADLYALSLAMRVRPLSPVLGGAARSDGLFVEIAGGAALTGTRVRPTVEAGIGWGIDLGDVTLAPVVRWQAIIEVDDPLDERPAHLALAGIELTFFDAAEPVIDREPRIGDRDGDGYSDDADACTEEPEDFDRFHDHDGCPEPDNDGDGHLDAADACPVEAEDRDGFEDDDGCPDRDNDGDGFPDRQDACPNEAEVINGVDDRDGCPDEGLFVLIDDRVVIDERVLFDFGHARVKHSARPILAAIVELYRQHPEWLRLRIEGHTDTRGSAGHNQRLSEARAGRVVEALIALGVPTDILESAGFGEARPRARGESEHAHQQNRRVEFVVVARRALSPAELEREERARRAAVRERRAR